MEEGGIKRWSLRRWDDIKRRMKPFLQQAGFEAGDYRWVPVTALGSNIMERIDQSVCSWYDGPSLLELVDSLELQSREPTGPLRVPVLSKSIYNGKVFLRGKIEHGSMKLGDKCTIIPGDCHCEIVAIQNTVDQ